MNYISNDPTLTDLTHDQLGELLAALPTKKDTTTRQAAIIVDVDGTVALRGNRGPYDWDRVREDQPNWPVLATVRMWWGHSHQLLFVSGREDVCRDDTTAWLHQHLHTGTTCPDFQLFMRTTKDHRPDHMIKDEIYRTQIQPFYEVEAVFDDRNRVVAMWRAHGLTVFQVADGDF